MKKLWKAPYKEFWLVFSDGVHPICKFMKRGYSHVYVITRDEYNWIKANPEQAYLRFTILPYAIDEDAPRLERPVLSTVLKLKTARRSSEGIYSYFGFMNCVNYVQYMLGIKTSAFTPYGLYKRLLNMTDSQKHRLGIQNIQHVA